MRRISTLLFVLIALVTQIAAQQVLYFHYKNGESFACETSDISFITYDMSAGSDVYDIQVIYFNDNTYQEINFAEIDSVGFNAPAPKLNKNAMVLDEKFEDYIIKGDTISFTMRKDTPANMRPKVGTVVGSTWDNAVFADGIVARVTSINETSEGIEFSCEKATLDDVYDEIFYYGYGDIYQDPNAQPNYDDTDEAGAAKAPKLAKGDWTLKGDKDLWHHEIKVTPPAIIVDDYKASLGVEVETTGRVKFYVHKPKGGQIYARFNFSSDFDAALSASLAGRNGVQGSSKSKKIVGLPLGIIATPIPIIFFKPELQINWYYEAMAELNGTFKASMDYDGEVEVTLEKGEWKAKTVRNVFNSGVDEFSLTLNGWCGVGLEPKIFVSLSGTSTGVGLATRAGVQLSGKLKMDFVNYLADGSLYESIKDSKLDLSLVLKGLLSAQVGLFENQSAGATLTFLQQSKKLYEGYLLPDFNYTSADDQGNGKYYASAALTPRDLLPWLNIKIGFAAFDDDNKVVDKQYVDTYSREHKPTYISTTFNLQSGRDYTIAPILNIMGFDIRASRATPVVPGEAVDLGLSVKWSSTNVGAEKIYIPGYTYQWGMTIPSHTYDTMSTTDHIGYPLWDKFSDMPYDISGTSYDPSTKWGEGWAMPTKANWDELLEKCTIETVSAIPRPEYDAIWITVGVKVTGPNGNHIYIPGNRGHWSATKTDDGTAAYYYGFKINGEQYTVVRGTAWGSKEYLIRPICLGD